MTRPEITQMSLTDISMPAADTVTAAEPDLTAELDDLLARQIEAVVTDDLLARWRARFLAEGLVVVSEICPPEVMAALRAEVERLIAGWAVRRDIRLPTTSNTPRKMNSVKRDYIARNSALVPLLYRSKPLLDLATRIAGEEVVLCPYDDEQFVIARLTEPGDTHGWHWDDYAYGMVWVLEAPPVEDGGFIQCVADTRWDKADPRLHEILCSRPIRSYALKSGDIYFLRSDTTLHGVYPLQRPSQRTILNLAWASVADWSREVVHETTDEVYTHRGATHVEDDRS
ncbi:MAG: hypothetical protein CMO30_05475 [Tistrella sp.]|uniref:Fe2OG dioxygenase domain-containing protein n=2 Tax=Tistrella mobilis TaxID=171437 RepID=A0A3B9IFF0_9PROT|nr:hypothetical protein [Tistrella sp.]HAE46017.1 hypothetical protein [Tistrella mobilis]